MKMPPPRLDLSKGKIRWGGRWLAHRERILSRIIPCGPPHYEYCALEDDPVLSSDEKAELIRFLLTLELWETTPGKKLITAFEVWSNSLTKGSAYAKELDDFFSLGWREDDLIDSYNFSFPSRFLPRFEEECDDLILSRDPTSSDPDVLEEFELTLDDILKAIVNESEGDIVLPSDKEILAERSTTTSYLSITGETMPHWQASLMEERFNTTELRGLRCKVPVYPGGVRDTIIADITANNSVRWLERSMRHILQFCPESAVCLQSSTFQRRLDDVVYTKGAHVLRDIKKCGITYNVRDIFPVIKRGIMKYFPDVRWNRFDIFNQLIIEDEDIEWTALRGYGLGMANHIVTLANIVIHYMARNTLKNYARSLKVGFEMKCITGNDDQDVVIYNSQFHDQLLAQEYLNMEHDIHGRLGNLTNFKKSVVSPTGLFYETYSKKGWEHKESLICNALACAYLAPNIRVAKHYIFSQTRRFNNPWAREQLRKLVAFWGGEFFDPEDELFIHFECGGWLNTGSLGLKTSLRDLEYLSERYDMKMISFAMHTCLRFITPPRPLYKKPGWVDNMHYTGPAKESHSLVQIFTLSDEDLREYYRKLTTYQRKYSRRLDTFVNKVKNSALDKDLEALQKILLKREPWYSIPDNLVEGISNREADVLVPVITERYRDIDNPVEFLLSEEYGGGDIDFERWDPQIPADILETRMKVNLIDLCLASQFSNYGIIPLVEYFNRWRMIPDIRQVTRIKTPGVLSKSAYSHTILSHMRVRRKKDNELLDDSEELNWKLQFEDPTHDNIINNNDMLMSELYLEAMDEVRALQEEIYLAFKTEEEMKLEEEKPPPFIQEDPESEEGEDDDDYLRIAQAMMGGLRDESHRVASKVVYSASSESDEDEEEFDLFD